MLLINEENCTGSFSHTKLNLFLCLHVAGFDLLIFRSEILCLYPRGILACNCLDLTYVLKANSVFCIENGLLRKPVSKQRGQQGETGVTQRGAQ